MRARCMVLVLVSWLITVLAWGGQGSAPAAKPISQQGLTEALRIGGLTTQELIDIVKARGVAFQVTGQAETDLRAAGAPPSLLEVIRANYRPPEDMPTAAEKPAPVKLGPLSQNEIATLLQVGTPLPRIAQIVNQRGVSFALTETTRRDLTEAGADAALLIVIEAAGAKPGAAVPTPPAESPARPIPAPEQPGGVAASSPSVARLASIKEVQKLYVDKMKNNLDQYLRAELSKQLPGRFVLVLKKEEADAHLIGTGEEQTGAGAALTGRYLGLHDTAKGAVSIVDKAGTVLWASEAGDRTLLFGPLKRGGAREVASRLVQDLKKSLDAAE